MSNGRILILNGTSSAGKSSIARHLQRVARHEQFLHVQLDAFRQMEPEGYFAAEHAQHAALRTEALCRAINAAAIAFAEHGQNVVIDHVLNSTAWSIALTELAAYDVLLVKVSCELLIAEERERQRPERKPGLARSQFSSVHAGRLYDFELNTTATATEELAWSLLRWYRTNPRPVALAAMRSGASAA